jgi:hypothetical protein
MPTRGNTRAGCTELIRVWSLSLKTAPEFLYGSQSHVVNLLNFLLF